MSKISRLQAHIVEAESTAKEDLHPADISRMRKKYDDALGEALTLYWDRVAVIQQNYLMQLISSGNGGKQERGNPVESDEQPVLSYRKYEDPE